MINNDWPYILLFLFSVLIASLSQIMLKKSAMIQYKNHLQEYLNRYVIIAYVFFFSASLLTTLAYHVVPLTLGPVLESTGYVYIAILGVLLLKEKLSKRRIIGNLLIIGGILIFAFL